jgi:hypothetical protein
MPNVMEIWRAIKTKRFWIYYVLFLACLLSIYQLPASGRALIGSYFDEHRSEIDKYIDEHIDVATQPSTRPDGVATIAKNSVAGFFDGLKTAPVAGPHVPKVNEIASSSPTAALFSLLLTAALKPSANRREITDRYDNADALGTARNIAGVTSSDDYVRKIAARYVAVAIAARQLRIAITYAILSGALTLIVRPDYSSSFVHNLPHLAVITTAAIIAALQGSFGFSRTKMKTGRMAVNFGFSSIFFGGVIAMCISIPYQAVRPVAGLTPAAVITVLCIRVILLPVFAGVAVYLLRRTLASLPIGEQ